MKREKKKLPTDKKLHISKVRPEDHISINAIGKNKKLEFEVTYAEITEQDKAEIEASYGDATLPIELIVHEVNGQEKPISFAGHSSALEFIAINPEGVYKWEHINLIKYTLSSGSMIHLIIALLPEGIKFNRRRGVRVNMDTRMEIEQDDKRIAVLVREMSYCGLSFINLSSREVDPSKPFVLNLIDIDEKKEKTFVVGKFYGKIQRQRVEEDGTVVYGCILAERHAEYLQKFIAMKQLENISGKKAYKGYQRNNSTQFWKEDAVDALEAIMKEK